MDDAHAHAQCWVGPLAGSSSGRSASTCRATDSVGVEQQALRCDTPVIVEHAAPCNVQDRSHRRGAAAAGAHVGLPAQHVAEACVDPSNAACVRDSAADLA
jgi:hypothetical protein